MTDLRIGGRGFVEQYAPANFEFDQLKYTFNVKVIGTDKKHLVFANGDITENSKNDYSIDFPDYFTTSSLYFHISEEGRFEVIEDSYQGLEKTIPLKAYSTSKTTSQKAIDNAKEILAELEADYGPYAHKAMLMYIAGSGGMEYCGATMTSMSALGHEITTLGLQEASCQQMVTRAGIDEGTARWRDRGYPTAKGFSKRTPINLSSYSPFQRHTPRIAYAEGSKLLSELDYMFRDTNTVKVILREFYTRYKNQTVTISDFKKVIEDESGVNMDDIFGRYVFGKDVNHRTIQGAESEDEIEALHDDHMPMSLEDLKYQ